MNHHNRSSIADCPTQFTLPVWLTTRAFPNYSKDHSCLRLRNQSACNSNFPSKTIYRHSVRSNMYSAYLPEIRNSMADTYKTHFTKQNSPVPLLNVRHPDQSCSTFNVFEKYKSMALRHNKKILVQSHRRKQFLPYSCIQPKIKQSHSISVGFQSHIFEPNQLFKNILLKRIVAPKYIGLKIKQL